MLEKKLDTVIELSQNLLALELSKNGMTHEKIRKHLGIGKETVHKMLKGIKRVKP